jgi:hypothetical protein
MVVREEEQALAPDDQQQPRMGALLLDDRSALDPSAGPPRDH